jgi:hypothetical protein
MKTLFATAMLLTAAAVQTAAGQADAALVQRLDSIAGHWVQRNYAVGIVAAVVKGNEPGDEPAPPPRFGLRA